MTLFTLQNSHPNNPTIYSTNLSYADLLRFLNDLARKGINDLSDIFKAFDENGYVLEVAEIFSF